MAWISVHEQVIGGKLRTLSKELNCSQNEALGMLVSLWLWGINNADKEGRIIGATKEDVAKILNIGIAKEIDSMDAVDALIKTKWIDFDADLFIHDWEEWQEQWYKAMAVREKDRERKRVDREKKKSESQTPSPATKQEPADSVANEPKPLLQGGKSKTENYSKDFEEFWDAYPRRIGKGEAYKKYAARIKDGWSPKELLEAAQNYKTKTLNERTEVKYIKHPKTFLSDATPFTDYIRKKDLPEKKGSNNNDDDPFAEWSE